MTHRFWPFDRRTAYILSAVLVPICVAVVVWLHRWNGKDETDVPPLALLLAVIVGLAPVLLVILSGVGSVEAAGVKLAFAAVQEVVTERGAVGARSLLANNLGTAPGQVQDSSGNTIIDSLREAVGNDVVVADLREGQAWWETRLLMPPQALNVSGIRAPSSSLAPLLTGRTRSSAGPPRETCSAA